MLQLPKYEALHCKRVENSRHFTISFLAAIRVDQIWLADHLLQPHNRSDIRLISVFVAKTEF
jgi:hypothetical protein